MEDENHHNPLQFGKTFKLHISDGFKTSDFVKVNSGGSRISQMEASTQRSAADPGFPRRGGGGAPTYYLAKVCRKLRENEENWTEKGGASKILLDLCRSATGGSANLLFGERIYIKMRTFGPSGVESPPPPPRIRHWMGQKK